MNSPINKRMKETKYVAFSTQKGGAGKTTLTVLVASYLHYVKGYDVAVIDCDFPQYSIHDMRKRDMDRISKDDYYKVQVFELIKTLQKKPYIIECSRAEDAIGKAEALQASLPLDFIFFDLPGTVNNAEVVSTLSRMDYIFTPVVWPFFYFDFENLLKGLQGVSVLFAPSIVEMFYPMAVCLNLCFLCQFVELIHLVCFCFYSHCRMILIKR